MSGEESNPLDDEEQRIVDLVRVLCDTESKLQELTGGELDCVAVDGGKTYLLAEAQERLRASEEAQRAAAETLTAILDALPAHIALLDEAGVILQVNEAWSRFAVGNSLQDSQYRLGLNYLDVCEHAEGDCSEEAHAASRGIRQVLMGGPNFNLDYPCHSPGRQSWFRLSVTPLRRDRRAGAVVMHIDVTERKLAEQKLEEIVQIQREISVALESLPDLLQSIVERAQKLTGAEGAALAAVEGDEMVYQAASGVLANTSGVRIKRDGSLSGLGAAGSVLYCADTEADSRVDLETCRILGVRSMIVAPLRVDTEIIGVLKVISRKPNGFSENDVSNISLLVETMSGIIHRRQIEDQLNESEKQYRLLFQNNPHPMMAYDLETLQFVAVNEAAAHQLGYSAEELLSMSLLDIRPPEDRDRLLQMMAASGHGNYSGVWRHLRKNGTIFDVEVHSDTVVFDGHSARLALTNDVTERLRSEREVARTSRALKMLSKCNAAVIHAENEATLLDQVCHIVVQTGG
jgi:PAS domain S-box-containing protein